MGTEQGIAEAASENKPKRGRPSVWASGPRGNVIVGRDTRAATDRGIANTRYAAKAVTVLADNGGSTKYNWLIGDLSGQSAIKDAFIIKSPAKLSVLVELGRIIYTWSKGEEYALKLADELCQTEPKPKVKEAAAWLRRWRLEGLGKDPEEKPGTANDLADAICELIDHYSREHDGVTPDMILEALASATAFYEWVAEEPEPESA